MTGKAVNVPRSTMPPTTGIDQTIRSDIAAAIFDQRLPPGTKLSEARLGKLYGVSRTVVRNALIRLSSDKLVDIRPNRGAAVAQPTVAEAHEVFQARRVIEPALLERSLRDMTAQKRRQVQALLEADRAASASQQRQQMIRASGLFHLDLARLSANTILCGFLEHLISRTSIIIAMYSDDIGSACSHDAHGELVGLIDRGDVVGAQQSMLEHLRDCEAQLNLSGIRPEPDLAAMLGVHRSSE